MILFNPSALLRTARAAAARAQAAQEAEEEQTLTPYSAVELAAGWEFKIIRSPRRLFGRPAYRERVLAEEHRAGWEVVEAFDHGRIRLKRPAPPTTPEAIEGYDPYRTVLPDWREPTDPGVLAQGIPGLVVMGVGVVLGILAVLGVFR
jgi:hypothetical protein